MQPIFNYRVFLFFVMKKKLQNVASELLPFSIHNHLFCCLRGSGTTGRCRLRTWYFIEATDETSYLDFNFTVNKDDLKECKVYSLIQDSIIGRLTLSIYYIVRQQWLEATLGGKSKNYSEVFEEVAISPLSLYIMFLNVLMRVYLNSLRYMTTLLSIMLILLPGRNKGRGCFILFLRNALSLGR